MTTRHPPYPHNATITVLGRRWRLRYVSHTELPKTDNANCDPPTTKHKSIIIRRSLIRQPCTLMEVLIHEMMHACSWPISEEFITQAAEDIARVLWQQGVRMCGDSKDGSGGDIT